MGNRKKLDQALFDDLPSVLKDQVIPNSVYFDPTKYALQKQMENRGTYEKYRSLEFNHVKGHEKWIKIYSVASSSRLCFLHFLKIKNFEFEKLLKIEEIKNRSVNAHYDGYNNNIYYECKCHEITDYHPIVLSEVYSTVLKKYFDMKPQKSDKEGKIKLFPRDFGIETSKNSMHFDLKQLVTHILGLIPKKETHPELHYVFFRPKEGTHPELDKFYDSFINELKQVKKSNFISQIKDKYNITFDYEFVPITVEMQL
mgnify:CR=1 FL=1